MRDVFSKGKEVELCFHFFFFEKLFLQFYFPANIHTPINAVVSVFMLTWTVGTELPLRILGELPSTT